MEKKKNIWTYFIKMFFVFMIIFIASQLGMTILQNSFTYLKYGPDIIMESIWAVLVVIVVFSFKNGYIFKQEKEKTSDSLKLGWPLLAIALIYLILNIVMGIVEGAKFDIPTILNLATYCLLIGLVEEFLCRGWLLNEFLERFSNNKKNIITSIILSSIIFGFIHIFNVAVGQSLADTLVQVLSATFIGIIFGLIYYKTKNIWSIVLIHAIWDFCVMLGESTKFVDCVAGPVNSTIIIYLIIVAVIVVIAYGSICYWLYKQTNLNDEIKPLNNTMYYVLPIIAAVLYIGIDLIAPKEYRDYYICPTYETKNVGNEYETQYYSHSKYDLEYTENIHMTENKNGAYIQNITKKQSFSLILNDKTFEIEFINNSTNEKITLAKNIYDYLLIDNKDSYVILIQNYYNKVLYGIYKKEYISNDKQYLENVKNELKEYIVPEINLIGSVKFGKSEYKYAQIQTLTYDKLYFDKDGTLYIANTE